MAELKTLSVQKRESLGKGFNRRLRGEQVIPCVFYNEEGENLAVQASAKELTKLFEEVGRTTVFNLEYDDNGKKVSKPSLIWDIQFHPYKRAFTHMDFYGVNLEKEVKLVVALEFVGTAKGTKLGGKLESYREKVTLKGKPLDIPSVVKVDVTEMGVNETIRVSDLRLPEGVSAHTAGHYALASVLSREAAEAENAD